MSRTDLQPNGLHPIDTDPQPSVFDSLVAIDAGVDHLLRHAGVTTSTVRDLVHGAVFTRGPADLHRTAIHVGGSDMTASEAVFKAAASHFFAQFHVSILFDANGANTTASAALLAVLEGIGGPLEGTPAVVLGSGPVGQRVARLLARLGADVKIGSPNLRQTEAAAAAISALVGRSIAAFSTVEPDFVSILSRAHVVVSAATAGVVTVPIAVRREMKDLKVAIDLNAVPPLGIQGVEVTDRGAVRDGVRV